MAEKHQVAIVDDEVEITDFLKEFMLQDFDCDVETFNDPIEALERFQVKKFDAISLDHRMPKLKGMDLVKLLRTSEGPNKNTKILLITGNFDEAECSHPELLDEVVFLEKPIRRDRYMRWMGFYLKISKEEK